MLFETPKIIDTEVFTVMPDKFRKKTVTSWSRANKGGAAVDCFLEGPAFDREGNLYVTDIPHGRIFRIAPDGEWALAAEYDGEPNGLKIHKDGRIFIADYRKGLLTLDPAKGKVRSYLPRRNSESFKGVNDLFFASNGDLYFTDQGQTGMHDPTGRVYRQTPSGRLDCLLNNVPSPNGVVLSPEENVLFVAVTRGNCIWRGPLMPDRSVSKVGVFHHLFGASGPDGLAMDEDGNLLVAHASMGCVWVFDRKGLPILRVESCKGDFITNMAFGWQDRRTLYMTESSTGSVLMARMPISGRMMYSHM
jgi:gluconolactonase